MKNQGVRSTSPSRRLATLLGLAAAWTLGCAGAPPPQDEIPSAESYYERGLEVLKGRRAFILFRDVDYEGAIELFQEVIDNYPYSEFATLSELKIADVYFDQDRFEEAAGYYQDFVELHPTHLRVSYAVYRRGLCGFSQMHASDQDQTPTREVVSQFTYLLRHYPESEYVPDARAKLRDAQGLLAEHIVAVGDFYFARGDHYAAAERYRDAMEKYPRHKDRLRTLYRLALALRSLGDRREAETALNEILRSEPDEDLAEDAQEVLDGLNGDPGD